MYQSVHGAAQASKEAAAAVAQPPAAAKAAHRPTDDEQHAARRVLDICKEVKLEPPLIAPSTRPDTKVVACALALYFGQKFESEAKAKEAFGLGASTDVRRRWVEDKLPRLFEHRPAAKQAAAVYFPPTPTTTHEDDCLWNATASASQPPPPPSTALAVAATVASVESEGLMIAEARDGWYELGMKHGKQAIAQELQEKARSREIALMREIRELRGAVQLLHTDLHAAARCVEQQVFERRLNDAELRCTKKSILLPKRKP